MQSQNVARFILRNVIPSEEKTVFVGNGMETGNRIPQFLLRGNQQPDSCNSDLTLKMTNWIKVRIGVSSPAPAQDGVRIQLVPSIKAWQS